MDCTGNWKEKIADDIKSYVCMQIDAVKLAVVEGLSTFVGKAIGIVVFLFMLNVALILFAGAISYGLGLLIDSWAWAAVIVGVVFLIVGFIFMRKPTIFINSMVGVFSSMFFENRKKREEDELS